MRDSVRLSSSSVIDPKKMRKSVQSNGVDSNLLKTLFDEKEGYDTAMLNKLLSGEININKDVLKRVFNADNDPELMKELFGEGNTTDFEKLVGVLKSGDNTLIDRLFSKNLLNKDLSKEML